MRTLPRGAARYACGGGRRWCAGASAASEEVTQLLTKVFTPSHPRDGLAEEFVALSCERRREVMAVVADPGQRWLELAADDPDASAVTSEAPIPSQFPTTKKKVRAVAMAALSALEADPTQLVDTRNWRATFAAVTLWRPNTRAVMTQLGVPLAQRLDTAVGGPVSGVGADVTLHDAAQLTWAYARVRSTSHQLYAASARVLDRRIHELDNGWLAKLAFGYAKVQRANDALFAGVAEALTPSALRGMEGQEISRVAHGFVDSGHAAMPDVLLRVRDHLYARGDLDLGVPAPEVADAGVRMLCSRDLASVFIACVTAKFEDPAFMTKMLDAIAARGLGTMPVEEVVKLLHTVADLAHPAGARGGALENAVAGVILAKLPAMNVDDLVRVAHAAAQLRWVPSECTWVADVAAALTAAVNSGAPAQTESLITGLRTFATFQANPGGVVEALADALATAAQRDNLPTGKGVLAIAACGAVGCAATRLFAVIAEQMRGGTAKIKTRTLLHYIQACAATGVEQGPLLSDIAAGLAPRLRHLSLHYISAAALGMAIAHPTAPRDFFVAAATAGAASARSDDDAEAWADLEWALAKVGVDVATEGAGTGSSARTGPASSPHTPLGPATAAAPRVPVTGTEGGGEEQTVGAALPVAAAPPATPSDGGRGTAPGVKGAATRATENPWLPRLRAAVTVGRPSLELLREFKAQVLSLPAPDMCDALQVLSGGKRLREMARAAAVYKEVLEVGDVAGEGVTPEVLRDLPPAGVVAVAKTFVPFLQRGVPGAAAAFGCVNDVLAEGGAEGTGTGALALWPVDDLLAVLEAQSAGRTARNPRVEAMYAAIAETIVTRGVAKAPTWLLGRLAHVYIGVMKTQAAAAAQRRLAIAIGEHLAGPGDRGQRFSNLRPSGISAYLFLCDVSAIPYPAGFVDALADHVVDGGLRSATAAMVAVAFAKADYHRAEFYDAAAAILAPVLCKLKRDTVVDLVAAYAAVSHCAPQLFDAAARRAVRELPRCKDDDLLRVMGAFEAVGHDSRDLAEAIHREVEERLQKTADP